MPAPLMSLFPHTLTQLEAARWGLQGLMAMTQYGYDTLSLGLNLYTANNSYRARLSRRLMEANPLSALIALGDLVDMHGQHNHNWITLLGQQLLNPIDRLHGELAADIEFIDFIAKHPPKQDWSWPHAGPSQLLDLPDMRLIDISESTGHTLRNYTVVFSPRAGHHSNIAEKTALYLKTRGLTRMAVVEQKCAEDIPLNIKGSRHYTNFDSQVAQMSRVIRHLKKITGAAPHLVAICQPGPLLLATLIRHPALAKTFGSAGSPMHTQAEKGFLTDFARVAGPGYIDKLLSLFALKISETKTGAGRTGYDGRLQVLGFYMLGMDQHVKNFKRMWRALHSGDTQAVRRQRAFYQWYNTVNHLPAGFIQDTYKKIFVNNDLIRGRLSIDGRPIRLQDYPAQVPIWALGGTRDDIAPPKQATGHLDLLPTMPSTHKLSLICEAGHMGLFRSQKILEQYYSRIADFLLEHSDR